MLFRSLCGAGGASNSDNRAAPMGLHNGFTNVGFHDGHAKSMNWRELTCVNYGNPNSPGPGDPGFQQQCSLFTIAKDYWSLGKIPGNTTAQNLGTCPP